MSQHDLVIRSGSVIDGTGEPAFTADVAIKDGRLPKSARWLDAASKKSAPMARW
jgi:N-acyl-D-aspartate/D-glutamate deacylase